MKPNLNVKLNNVIKYLNTWTQLIIQVNVVLLKFHAFNNVTKKFNFAKWNFISWKNVKIQNLNALNVIPFYFSIN